MRGKVLVLTELRGKQMHTMRPEAEIFIGLKKAGFEVAVMTNGDTVYRDRFESCGLPVIPFYPERKIDGQAVDIIRRELIRGKYDLMYTVTDNRAVTNGIRSTRGLNVALCAYRGYAGNLAWYDPVAYTKHLHPRIDAVICNGKNTADYLCRQLFFRCSKARIIVKGHLTSWYQDVQEANLSSFGIPEDAFTAIWVGHNRERMKGLEYLIRAVHRIPGDLRVHALLIGSNTETEDNLRLVENGPHSQRIHFGGVYNDPRGIVAASDAFVLPSVKGEACTRAVQEAMSMGVTPVISDIPGNRELVDHGVNGLIFRNRNVDEITQCLAALAGDRQRNVRLGAAAKEKVQNTLSYHKTVADIAGIFDALIEKVRDRDRE